MTDYSGWIAAAVIVSALALIGQAAFLFAIFRSVSSLRAQLSEFLPRAEQFLRSAEKTLADSSRQIQEVSSRANTLLETTQLQINRIDEFVGEVTTRTRAKMEQVEAMLDDSLTRVQQTVDQLNEGLARPVREVSAVAAGMRAAFGALFRGNRATVAQATADEEMFI